MTKISKDFPAQKRERYKWIVDTVRENQLNVIKIIDYLIDNEPDIARDVFIHDMHKHDRDALLVQGGILTESQIKILNAEIMKAG